MNLHVACGTAELNLGCRSPVASNVSACCQQLFQIGDTQFLWQHVGGRHAVTVLVHRKALAGKQAQPLCMCRHKISLHLVYGALFAALQSRTCVYVSACPSVQNESFIFIQQASNSAVAVVGECMLPCVA